MVETILSEDRSHGIMVMSTDSTHGRGRWYLRRRVKPVKRMTPPETENCTSLPDTLLPNTRLL